MKLPRKAGHRFLVSGSRLYLQPFGVYKYKIFFCAVLTLSAFVVAAAKLVNHDWQQVLIIVGCLSAVYAVFDVLFRINLTYIFDGERQGVYRKFPGLFTQKLMSFDEACVLPETEYGSLRYTLSRKKNKYGKSFPLSDFFSDSKKGRQRQLQFEEEILTVIITFVEDKSPYIHP